MKTALLLVGCAVLAGCSAAQVQKAQTVVVQMKADAKTAVVIGCQGLPAMEVIVGVVTPLVPQLAASGPAIAVGESTANALCKAVLQSPGVTAP